MRQTYSILSFTLLVAASMLLFSSCSGNEADKLAREKAQRDSIAASERKEEKSLEDSMVQVAKSPQREKEDSTSAPVDGAGDPGVK